MNLFGYARASDRAASAAAVAGDPAAQFIAGGTSLLDLMKLGVEAPARVEDITRLNGLDKIEELSAARGGGGLAGASRAAKDDPKGGLLVGALVRNSDLAHDSRVISRFPALSQALLSGASAQLRNMATVGGNLLQRTRCPYFRDPHQYEACNKRNPGSGCAAMEGYNRTNAVLGTSQACIATHPSDMNVALAALDAIIHIEGPGGKSRTVPAAEFHVAPGEHPEIETVLKHGELITAVELHDSPLAANSLYLKVRDRASYEFALASAAVALEVGADGTIKAARVALGGVATKPWRSQEAEKALVGTKPGADAYKKAAEAALADAKPHKYNGFKIDMAKRTLVRALEDTAALATKRGTA